MRPWRSVTRVAGPARFRASSLVPTKAIRPSRPDNHLWDVLVLACVAASVAGVRWEPGTAPTGPAPERPGRKGVDFAELVKRNRAMKAGRGR